MTSRAPLSKESNLVSDRPPGVKPALWLAVAAAVALVLGALLPVVEGVSPGFGAKPLLIVLALVPVGLVVIFVLRKRYTYAAGVLIGLAALAPGRLLLDLQAFVNSAELARPEFYLPQRYESPPVGPGLWALLAGHLLTIAAGIYAGRVARDEAEALGRVAPRRWWQLLAPVPSVLIAVGLLMAPFGSSSDFLLGRGALESSTTTLLGYLLLACALPLAASLTLGTPSDGAARGTLFGLAAGSAVVVLPSVFAGFSVKALSLSAGPVVVLVGVIGLVLTAVVPGTGTEPAARDEEDAAGQANLPGISWWRLVTAVLGVATAAFAVLGCLSTLVTSSPSVLGGHPPDVQSPARWLLLAAGILMGLVALLSFRPAVRPALSVVWIGIVLTGAAVLATPAAATRFNGAYSAGPGVVWVCLAMFTASVTAISSVVSGFVERDDAEDAGEDGPRPGAVVLVPLVLAAPLAICAFGLPILTAPGYLAPGIWSEFDGSASWGLLAALITVLGVLALVPRSRPARAAMLLAGAAAVVCLRAAELPALSGTIVGARTGPGFWLALGCALVLLIAAGISAAGGRRRA